VPGGKPVTAMEVGAVAMEIPMLHPFYTQRRSPDGKPVMSGCVPAGRFQSGQTGLNAGPPVHRPVIAGPIPEPCTGRDSSVAPVLAGPYVGLAGV
jgi:hypothetical protein